MPEGFPANVTWPLENSALLIIDVQKDFIKEFKQHKKIIPKINKLAEAYREKGWPVIHFRYEVFGDERSEIERMTEWLLCEAGTEGAEEVDELRNEDDLYITKSRYSGFFGTNLDEILEEKGIDTVVLTGLLTHACIFSTASDAYQRNYRVVFVSDGISSYRKVLHKELLKHFKDSVGEVSTSTKLLKRIQGKEKLGDVEEIDWEK